MPTFQDRGPRSERVPAREAGQESTMPPRARTEALGTFCGLRAVPGRDFKRIGGLAKRQLAICRISGTDWFSGPQTCACAGPRTARSRPHLVSPTDPNPSCGKRQSDMKDSPMRIVGRCLKGPTVGLDAGSTNREPHPHPIGFRREEGVKDAVHVARIDSRA